MIIIRITTDGSHVNGQPFFGWAFVVNGTFKRWAIAVEPKFTAKASNNVAEYHAVHEALKHAMLHLVPGEAVNVYTDSRLVVEQLNGKWKVRSPNVQKYHAVVSTQIDLLKRSGHEVTVDWIPREENTEADALTR